MYQENPKLKRQLERVLSSRIPWMVITGEDEVAGGIVKLKNMAERTEEIIPRDAISDALLARGCGKMGQNTIAANPCVQELNACTTETSNQHSVGIVAKPKTIEASRISERLETNSLRVRLGFQFG